MYKFSGSITDKVMIKNMKTNNVSEFMDVATMVKSPKYVKPVVKQDHNESRRVWHKVSYSLDKAKYSDANVHKNVVEEAQRAIRKEREESKIEHKPKYFVSEGEEWRCIFENVKEYSPDEEDLDNVVEKFAVDDDEREFIKKYAPDSVFNI